MSGENDDENGGQNGPLSPGDNDDIFGDLLGAPTPPSQKPQNSTNAQFGNLQTQFQTAPTSNGAGNVLNLFEGLTQKSGQPQQP